MTIGWWSCACRRVTVPWRQLPVGMRVRCRVCGDWLRRVVWTYTVRETSPREVEPAASSQADGCGA